MLVQPARKRLASGSHSDARSADRSRKGQAQERTKSVHGSGWGPWGHSDARSIGRQALKRGPRAFTGVGWARLSSRLHTCSAKGRQDSPKAPGPVGAVLSAVVRRAGSLRPKEQYPARSHGPSPGRPCQSVRTGRPALRPRRRPDPSWGSGDIDRLPVRDIRFGRRDQPAAVPARPGPPVPACKRGGFEPPPTPAARMGQAAFPGRAIRTGKGDARPDDRPASLGPVVPGRLDAAGRGRSAGPG